MRTSIRDFNIVLWISLILCVLLLLGNPLPPAAVVLVVLIIMLNLTILCWLFFLLLDIQENAQFLPRSGSG